MSIIRIGFLQPEVDDLRYGWDGAGLLALIRYACSLTSERNGRVQLDGEMWWYTSRSDIAKSLGGHVSVDSVKRTIKKLEAAGALLSRGVHADDRTRAYRVLDQPKGEFAQPAKPATSQKANSPKGWANSPKGLGEFAFSSSSFKELKEELEEPPYPPNVVPLSSGQGKALDHFRELNRTARPVNGTELVPTTPVTAHQIAEAFSASLPTPIERGLLSGIGKQINNCLKSGIPPSAIAEGLKAWTASDSWSPTQIPNFVHKVNNRSTTTTGKPTKKAQGYDQALAELLQEVQTR